MYYQLYQLGQGANSLHMSSWHPPHYFVVTSKLAHLEINYLELLSHSKI
jgi:hypothetical protein